MRQAPTSAPDDIAGPDLLDTFDDFELHLRARNRSALTIRSYRGSVQELDRFLAARGMPRSVTGIRREHLESFIGDQLERLRPASAGVRYRSLAQYFKFVQQEGLVPVSPMLHMRPPSVVVDPAHVLTEDEQDALKRATAGTSFEARRDRAMVALLVDSGLRLAELAGLDVQDLDTRPEQLVATVIGKGRKIRTAPFDVEVGIALRRYLKAREDYLRKHPGIRTHALWVGRKGALSASGCAQALKRRASQAGLVGFHAHLGRHTAAHTMLGGGMAETDVMRVLGWTSRSMVERYAASTGTQRAIASFRTLKDRTRR